MVTGSFPFNPPSWLICVAGALIWSAAVMSLQCRETLRDATTILLISRVEQFTREEDLGTVW